MSERHCHACLSSVDVDAATCPACGERLDWRGRAEQAIKRVGAALATGGALLTLLLALQGLMRFLDDSEGERIEAYLAVASQLARERRVGTTFLELTLELLGPSRLP